MEKKFVGGVYKALLSQYSSFTDDLKQYGVEYAKSRLTREYLNTEIAPVILEIHKEAGIVAATKTLSNLKKQLKEGKKYRGFGFNEEWAADIKDYFDKYLLNKSVFPISETTRNRILEVLSKGIEEGWGVDEMVRQIRDIPEIRGRAKMIVRTETTRAANYGTFLGADKFDFEVEKEWIAARDKRTRRSHSHLGVDGQIRDVYERFSNGLMFPGDLTGAAKEVINCRCNMAWITKKDERGRPIPKKSPVRVGRYGNLIDILGGVTAGIMIGNLLNEIDQP
jgi:hypothetical protein